MPEHVLVFGRLGSGGRGFQDLSRLFVEHAWSVPGRFVAFFRIFVALPFLGEDVEQLRPRDIPQIPERLSKSDDIVPIDGSEVAEMERFEEVAVFHQYSFQTLLSVFEQLLGERTHLTDMIEELSYLVADEIERM